MKTLAITVVATLAAVMSFGDTAVRPATNRNAAVNWTPEKLAAARAARLRHFGGIVEFAGKGKIAILNAQESLSEDVIAANLVDLKKVANGVVVEVARVPFTLSVAKKGRETVGAAAAVYVIDDPTLPMSLVALEEQWGFVNVAALREGDPDAAKLASRFRKEFIRITSVVFSGARSQFKTSPLQACSSAKALDRIVGDNYGMDTMTSLMNYLPEIGVRPVTRMLYRTACQRGIAPAPTNDVQKAIWEEFKAKPTEPMRIKFDPKKGE